MNNGGCPVNGWSVISAASTNSQLAGVLAGFLFAGILILFGRPGPKNTQTLSLFASTFVLLTFDSYLYSLVAGGSVDQICIRVWTEAMAASGMLAVGGVALIEGIAWLLSHHADGVNDGEVDRQRTIDLERLSRFMLFGVMSAVMLLLGAFALDYLEIFFSRPVPVLLGLIVSLSPVLVGGGVAVILTLRRAARMRQVTEGGRAIASTRMLAVSVFALLAYAIGGPVFSGALTVFPASSWDVPPVSIAILALVLELVIPVVIIVLLVLSAPPFTRTDAVNTVADCDPLTGADDGGEVAAVEHASQDGNRSP